MTTQNDTQKKGERPGYSVSITIKEGEEEKTVFVGSAWRHKKGGGFRIKLDKPGNIPADVQYINVFPRKEKVEE
jgi:hypothetical protein